MSFVLSIGDAYVLVGGLPWSLDEDTNGWLFFFFLSCLTMRNLIEQTF